MRIAIPRTLLLDSWSTLLSTASAKCYCTVWPPSTTKACPTVKAAASQQSQTTAFAISSGRPILPIGSSETTFARPSAVPAGEAIHHRRIDIARANGVHANVLRGVVEGGRAGEADHSVFRRGVRRAALDADDASTRGRVHDGSAPCLSISGISCFMHRKTPRRSMSMIRFHSSSS
jgi:hypothetical protein